MEEKEGFVYIFDGDGSGDGFGSGDKSGYGYSDNEESGSGYSYGYGYSDGYGPGYAEGDGDGCGDGYGSGYGDGTGYGNGYVDDYAIKSINGDKVYIIDGVQTIIKSVRGNIAKGLILHIDLTLTPCFIVKENNVFAHGNTLHEVFEALQEKLYDESTEEERISKFKEHFNDFSKKYPASDLFVWHHILTGSCKAGREAFCCDHGIDVNKDSFTVYEFVELTKDSYKGEIINKLIQ